MCLNCENNSRSHFVLTDVNHLERKPEAPLAVTARTCTLIIVSACTAMYSSTFEFTCDMLHWLGLRNLVELTWHRLWETENELSPLLPRAGGEKAVLRWGITGGNRSIEWWGRRKDIEDPSCFAANSVLNVCNKLTAAMLWLSNVVLKCSKPIMLSFKISCPYNKVCPLF